jgi:heme-degrading monooxygenase HmoA
MYARVNIIFGEQDKVDDAIAHIEGADRSLVEGTSGNRGLATLVDRTAGVVVAMSYWDEPLHSSEASLTRAREGAAAAAGGDLVVEGFELAEWERASVPGPGAAVRVTRVQLDPTTVAEALGLLHDDVLAQVSGAAGFCSAEVLIDRGSGAGMVVTTWADEDSARGADRLVERLRTHAGDRRIGARFPRTEAYSLVRTSARMV